MTIGAGGGVATNLKFGMAAPYQSDDIGRLILRKIIKIVATRCHMLRLKCTKIGFGWVLPEAPLGSLQRSPDP